MNSFWRSLFSVLVATLIATHAGHARAIHAAPEMDPAMGTAALALLGGAILIIKGRRKS